MALDERSRKQTNGWDGDEDIGVRSDSSLHIASKHTASYTSLLKGF
jgi:hypothetical protein